MASASDAAAERLAIALELYEVGERMLRQRLRRERPHATPDEIDAEVASWLRRRPGAEYGDHSRSAVCPNPVNRVEAAVALKLLARDVDAVPR